MTVEEKIIRQIQGLSESKKAAVLDFVEFLNTKKEDKEWSDFSLASAMNGMEEEETPYTLDDLKESFS